MMKHYMSKNEVNHDTFATPFEYFNSVHII